MLFLSYYILLYVILVYFVPFRVVSFILIHCFLFPFTTFLSELVESLICNFRYRILTGFIDLHLNSSNTSNDDNDDNDDDDDDDDDDNDDDDDDDDDDDNDDNLLITLSFDVSI